MPFKLLRQTVQYFLIIVLFFCKSVKCFLPTAAGLHVNYQNENVIINVQMDKHPERAQLKPA